ncbi:nitrite reductase small subunit NirD [Nocardiopsis metallicus]|uniref:Nitrite reductase (NADH) small subunit n=1 Tax=Nocardiopsis metallicus TaxID=179819 RepID=A0A840WB29_9ACTN|nr:nitrite reductase small subunit NirD [Nocardiopsis metallicus]MBB5490231.1 nitrite reductase (NADH) small subunit [Nocardiopsis metallicus]
MSVLTHTATAQEPSEPTTGWIHACPKHRLEPGIGLAVLLPDGHQVALFTTRDHHLYAVDNLDPHTGATVISRGIVGDRAGEPTVASPMLKHVFSLTTGQSLDAPDVRLNTWPVRVDGENVQIATTPHPTQNACAPAQSTTRAEQGTP